MASFTRNEIVELLKIPFDEFEQTIFPQAKAAYTEARGNVLLATAVLSYSNICKNSCLYCGMRSQNRNLKRFRMSPDEIIEAAKHAREMGFTRVFMVSGEDMGFGFDNILRAVRGVSDQGFFISLACGEFTEDQYRMFLDAGVDEYVVKFEMADEAVFNRLNPSTTFEKRMNSIRNIQKSGLRLASGGIVDYPGQTPEQLADDILLSKELGITWAPNIPYQPVIGSPLAEEGGPGSPEINLRHIAILRILMPDINITAQQPGRMTENGMASNEQGSLDALNAGANILFFDLTPKLLAQEFRAVDNRHAPAFENLRAMSEQSGMPLAF